MLRRLRDLLAERGEASLADLAARLDADPAAVRDMLGHWIAKGRVARRADRGRCGGCADCDPAQTEVYEWVETPGTHP